MANPIILLDDLDPVGIAMMSDPEVQKLFDAVDANTDDYDTLFAGIRINENNYENDEDDEDDDDDDEIYNTFHAIDDNSDDPLDIIADEKIEDMDADDDSDGDLIDIIMSGVNIEDLSDDEEE